MGIDGLWPILDPAAQACTLNDICLMNGYSAVKKDNVLRIGVDISVIMNECIAAEHASPIYRYKTSNELRIFFFKLCKLLRQAPGILIFVFDGPNRPSFKHGRNIDTHTVPDWTNNCKTIIEAFGFYWHQAPGEAEAELAMLSRYDAIDAVMTSDSDALVFGAQCLIKPINGSDQYLLYSMDVVENTVGLSRGGLLLVALLSKGDYSDGLAGCGPGISASLARCGFGDRILHAVERLEDFKLRRELETIAVDIRAELLSNSRHFLHSRYPMLASNFSVGIISQDKISSFLDPIVTRSPLPSLSRMNTPLWIAKEPSIPRISQFCMQTFGWARTSLEKKFKNVLWPGVFLRILTSPLLVYTDAQKLCVTPCTRTNILTVTIGSRKNKTGRWGRVKYSTDNFVALIGVSASRMTPPKTPPFWVSAEYLPAADVLMPIVHHSPQVSPHASTSLLVPASQIDSTDVDLKPTNHIGESSKLPDSPLSIGESSESPDPPSITSLLRSVKSSINEKKAQNLSEVIEITDSESDVEVVCPPHKRVRVFSPDVIVISD